MKLAYKFLIGLLFFGVPMMSISQSIQKSADQEVAHIKRVSKAEFKEYLKEHENVQLIDVRTPGEFNQGTIEGAVNIDFYDPAFKAEIAKLDKSVPTLIFCRSGGRSAMALKQFKAEGFTFVLELDGGYLNW